MSGVHYVHPILLGSFLEKSLSVGWWKLQWVKLWGVKRVVSDEMTLVTMYYYGGCYYVTKVVCL